jgi:hypothetical protein
MVLDHLLPSVQPQFLEWTPTSFEGSLATFYTILVEEHLKVVLGNKIISGKILFLPCSLSTFYQLRILPSIRRKQGYEL